VGGLHTESSPLVHPENTAKDLDNVDLSRDGSIRRRRGLEFELGGSYSTPTFIESDLKTQAVSVHEWDSVDGDDTKNFAVVQIGGTLYFHNRGDTSLSNGIIGSMSLAPVQTRDDYENYVVSSDFGKGKLFMVSPAISPIYLQYDSESNTFTGVKLTLKIRDTDGLPEDEDSPLVFGDDVTPSEGVNPEDDIDDVTDSDFDPGDFVDFEELHPGGLF
tara:strand:- start:527 stop:1177 length:651 start_codon:yes stop_codon:yes gene_type:complete